MYVFTYVLCTYRERTQPCNLTDQWHSDSMQLLGLHALETAIRRLLLSHMMSLGSHLCTYMYVYQAMSTATVAYSSPGPACIRAPDKSASYVTDRQAVQCYNAMAVTVTRQGILEMIPMILERFNWDTSSTLNQ